jgi:long-chain acyl-CoA synthetase
MDLNQLADKLKASQANSLAYYEKGKKCTKSFQQVYADVKRATAYCWELGLRPGHRVGLVGKNSYEWIVLDLACVIRGIITVPLDPGARHSSAELVEEFELSFLFTSQKDLLGTAPQVRPLGEVVAGPEPDGELKQVQHPGEGVFTLICTSGTSGKAKAIEVKKKSFDHLVQHTQDMYQFNDRDRFLVFLPLHIYLERCYVYAAILYGFSVIVTPVELVFHAIRNDRPTVIVGIPYFFESVQRVFLEKIGEKWHYRAFYGLYRRLRKAGLGFLFGGRFVPFIKAWGGGIRYLLTGAAPIKKSVLEFYRDMGIILYEGYGMSEIGGMITLNSPGAYKLGSVGKPFPHKKITFDAAGQIHVQSDYHANATYYKGSREQNEATYHPGGVVATGDLGYLDKDGFLFINGRSKDLIILSTGKKVHPHAVEEKIENSGLCRNSLVYGNDKPYLVALLNGKGPAADVRQALEKLNAGVPEEEKVRCYHLIDEPFTPENGLLTASMKVNRNGIIRKYQQELEALYN